MAKQKEADNAVVIDEKILDAKATSEPLEEVVVEENIIPKAMKVEVTPTKTFRSDIGGTRYSFVKNSKQKVPADVARVLRERDLIK